MNKLTAFTLGLLVVIGSSTNAAEIKIFSANGARLIMEALAPQFECATSSKLTIKYNEAGTLKNNILDGEAFDVTFLPAVWDEIRGKISGDPVAIARTDLGIGFLSLFLR